MEFCSGCGQCASIAPTTPTKATTATTSPAIKTDEPRRRIEGLLQPHFRVILVL